jgi:hypothetical protein
MRKAKSEKRYLFAGVTTAARPGSVEVVGGSLSKALSVG